MSPQEYRAIQQELTKLAENNRKLVYQYSSRERQAYQDAVLACKSVLSHYNPERKVDKLQ